MPSKLKASFLVYLRTAWKVCVLHYCERPKSLAEKWEWKAEVEEPRIVVARRLVDEEYREFENSDAVPAEFIKPKDKSKPKVNFRVCCSLLLIYPFLLLKG